MNSDSASLTERHTGLDQSSGDSEDRVDQVRTLAQFRMEFTGQIPGLHRIGGIHAILMGFAAEVAVTNQIVVDGVDR